MDKYEKSKVPQVRFRGFNDFWQNTNLGALCREFQSGTFIKAAEIARTGDYPVYGGNGLRGYTNSYTHDGLYALIGRQGALCGNVNLSHGKAFFTEHAIAVQADDLNDTIFAYYLMGTMSLGQHSAQSAQPGLAVNKLLGLPVFTGEKKEQEKIGSYFRELDQLIQKHQDKHDKLVTLKQSMLQRMFPQPGATMPEIRFKGFWREWAEHQLESLVEVCSGRDYKHLSPGNIPVYGTGGYMLSVDKALSYDKDAVGIGRKGTIDRPYLLRSPFWTVDTLFYALPKKGHDLDFLYSIFQKTDWKKYDESTGVPSLSKTAINEVVTYVPDLEEQQKIGLYFSQLDELISSHSTQLEKLKQVKAACLEKMFV